MFVCEYEMACGAAKRPSPPTREIIEQNRRKQLDVLKELRRKLSQTVRIAVLRTAP